MNSPFYGGPYTPREQRFTEAHDDQVFQELLDAGEICAHGYETGKCLEGCEDESTNLNNRSAASQNPQGESHGTESNQA